MKKMKYRIFKVLLITGVISCRQEAPMVLSSGGTAPDPVRNVRIENQPGGAKLTYDLPLAEDLLYVKAVWEYPAGKKHEVRSSMYVDSLKIEGIGNTEERPVQVFAVSRSEKVSDPVMVTIKPQTPPVLMVAASLQVKEAFGGVSVRFNNNLRANVVITVLRETIEGWAPVDAFYTNLENGIFNTRGLEAEPTTFGVVVRDHWLNRSDTVKTLLTPLFEQKIAAPTPITYLPGDYNQHYSGLNYTYMFNNIYTDYMGTLGTATSNLPLSFTLDFRAATRFSRLKYWMRGGTAYSYNYCSPEEFELWGTNELNNDWSKWTKIMDCKVVKPSGSPLGVLTTLDNEVAAAGIDFEFPADVPPYRYLRWRSNRVFGGLPAVQIAELAFWGKQN